jgi:phage/plasmid-associated DNA primase
MPATANAPSWQAILDEIIPDQKLRCAAQELFGAALMPSPQPLEMSCPLKK